MNTDNTSDDRDKFKEAGEQAARVVGEFFTMAGEFSRRFEENFDQHRESANQHDHRRTTGYNDKRTEKLDEDWRKAKDYLNNAGDAAGAALDGFASGIKKGSANDAGRRAGEWSGQRSAEWMDQASDLLRQTNPADFFDKLKTYCEPTGEQTKTSATSARHEKLNELFSDQEALGALTDQQFEELFEFMQSNYQAALQLVRNR